RYFFRDVQYNSEKTLRGIKEREGNVPFCCCGTGNFSISRQALINAGMFDESFKVYGHEDVEFVYRLIKKKVRILFNPNAIAHHRIFPRSVDYHLKQKEMIGYSALQFYKKYPELKGILHVDEICSLKGSPSDIIRKLARVITVNRISVILLRRCLPIFEKVLPDFMLFSIYNRLSGYYLRKGLLKR
ncbi:hypothetical protein KAW55_05415, partial [bacterium]|nr:hypothetical protein [bacterium]